MHQIEWRILWQNGGQHPCCFVHNHLCSKDSLYEPMKIFHVTRGGQLPKEGQDPRDEDLLMFEVSRNEPNTRFSFHRSRVGILWVPHGFDLLRPLWNGGVQEQWIITWRKHELRTRRGRVGNLWVPHDLIYCGSSVMEGVHEQWIITWRNYERKESIKITF